MTTENPTNDNVAVSDATAVASQAPVPRKKPMRRGRPGDHTWQLERQYRHDPFKLLKERPGILQEIHHLYGSCNGNINEIAKRVGTSRNIVGSLLKEFPLVKLSAIENRDVLKENISSGLLTLSKKLTDMGLEHANKMKVPKNPKARDIKDLVMGAKLAEQGALEVKGELKTFSAPVQVNIQMVREVIDLQKGIEEELKRRGLVIDVTPATEPELEEAEV